VDPRYYCNKLPNLKEAASGLAKMSRDGAQISILITIVENKRRTMFSGRYIYIVLSKDIVTSPVPGGITGLPCSWGI
jgi:hypothetical protein